MQQVRPFHHRIQLARQLMDRLQAQVGPPAGVGQRHDVVAVEHAAGDPAELRRLGRVDAVELVHAQAQLAA